MNINGNVFSGPYSPFKGFDSVIAAVYAILDSRNTVIDVGQSEDLNNRFPNHQRENCWRTHGIGDLGLYILRENSEQNRLRIESGIRQRYNPLCGDR